MQWRVYVCVCMPTGKRHPKQANQPNAAAVVADADADAGAIARRRSVLYAYTK